MLKKYNFVITGIIDIESSATTQAEIADEIEKLYNHLEVNLSLEKYPEMTIVEFEPTFNKIEQDDLLP